MSGDLVTIQAAHDDYINSLLAGFQGELGGIIASAQSRTTARLRDKLSITAGKIDRSVRNTRTLRRLDSIFLEEMDRAGYDTLLNELIQKFPGQLSFFQDTLEILSAETKQPLTVEFGPRDLQVFADQGLSAKDGLRAVMETVAAQAKNRILLSVAGLPFADLAESLAGYLNKGLPEAVGLAETATATYYRIIADRGYQIIENDLPSESIFYRYEGPLDKLTRPFCTHLLRAKKPYTRAEIDDMSNGQIPNVFISAGGWRCRHQWVISLTAPPKKKRKATTMRAASE